MLIADLDYSFFGWNKYFAIYGPYTYTEDWHEYPDYSSDPPTNKGDFLPLIDNGDSSKYYPVTINGQTYKIYNSAILNNNTGLYICLVCDRPWNTYQLNHDGSQSGEAWIQFQSINEIAQNGVYTCGYDEENPAFLWHSDGFLYNQGSYYDKEITEFHNIETELPIFTNNDDYMNYITNPVEKATCRVNYYLPDSDYTYTKITYKMNDKPQSVNDGTIVNIDPSQNSVDISNLTVHGNYWFTIFTNKSESEAFPYTVEEMERPFYILPKLSAKFKIFCSSGTDVELSVQEIYDKLTTSGHIAPEEAKTFILYQTTSARGYVIGLFPVYTSSLKLYTKEGLSQEYTDDYITGIDYDNATSYNLRFYLNADLTLYSLGYGSTYLTSYKTINDVWISAWGTSITGAIMPIVYCNTNPSEYSSIYLNDKQISVNVN